MTDLETQVKRALELINGQAFGSGWWKEAENHANPPFVTPAFVKALCEDWLSTKKELDFRRTQFEDAFKRKINWPRLEEKFMDELEQERDALRAQVEKMRAALGFYGKVLCSDDIDDTEKLIRDRGKIARETLREIDEAMK